MKPESMSVREWLVKTTSKVLVLDEQIVNSVVMHQFDSATDAINLNNSVEISGFGKFLFNKTKAQKKMIKLLSQKKMYEENLEDDSFSVLRKTNIKKRLYTTDLNIKHLKPKLDEIKPNSGGVEEPFIP
jgi:nucleoid DNA-binding protein